MSDPIEQDDPQAVYSLDEQVGYLLRLASQRHTLIFQQHISDDLTPTQFATLIRIAEHGEVSQNHLGRLAAMDVATIKGVVDRLRAKGLVRSTPDLQDRRRSVISLTQAGERTAQTRHTEGHLITQKTLEPLNPAEQKTLLALLKKIS
jgi:DNA-binding MarR family transcriptional regulator